ncbi:thioredoxin domain-containing protein [Corynebacterium sp. 3HC-13]|uniref:DsbA family protein n=1 Tax=Corynebacterium poyangense TaxID=2684405 RepID=UPI001CC903FD|nr:DsbA family protein [Corynebacterium poyangense]MBZ8177593.1 thioredoxin domain-containing protein [Corynebacterium poyangense]
MSHRDDSPDLNNVSDTHGLATADQSPTAGVSAPPSSRSWKAIPAIAWLCAAVLIAVAAVGGYVLGHQTATPTTQELAARAHAGKITNVPRPQSDGSYDATISGPGREPEDSSDVLSVHRRNPADPLSIGALDAPVVISEYSDFYCPYCQHFNEETEPLIIKDYVNKGLVRLEWNDVPAHGDNSIAAAKAARAAAAQNKFFEYKNALFKKTSDEEGNQRELSIDDFVEIAKEVRVPNLEKFRADATSKEFDDVLANAQQQAASIGVTGTPSFYVGTKFIGGAQPYEQFQAVITQELAKVASGEVKVPEVK